MNTCILYEYDQDEQWENELESSSRGWRQYNDLRLNYPELRHNDSKPETKNSESFKERKSLKDLEIGNERIRERTKKVFLYQYSYEWN